MRAFHWNPLKNERLKQTRGVSFEELIEGKVINIVDHPSREKQSIMLIEFKGYIWVVPFVETDEGPFLKTLYPSRKYTKKYRKGGSYEV